MTSSPPGMVNQTHIRGQIQMLELQRNMALNECALAAGEIAVLREENQQLKEVIQKLGGVPDRKEHANGIAVTQ